MNIKFTNILEVDDNIVERVRQWRNDDSVRLFMYNKHEISKEEHLKWIENLATRVDRVVYVVYIDDLPSGVALYNDINHLDDSAEWAFYTAPYENRSSVGVMMEYYMIDNFFNVMNMKELTCEVYDFNNKVISLHKKFGFEETGKKDIDGSVTCLKLDKETWEKSKQKLLKVVNKLTT